MITSFFISSPRTTEAYKKARENKNLAEIDKYADIQKAETRAEVAKIEAKAKAAVIKEYIESYMSGGVVSAAEAARMANAHLDDNARSLWYGTFSDGEKSATDMLTAFAASYIENMNAGKGGKGK
jgi:hypothetical protein